MIKLSDKEFQLLTGYIHSNFGVNLEKKRTLIEGRMNNYLLRKGFDDYSSYLDMLFSDKTGEELTTVLNILTTNYSYFMREWEHFEHYKTKVLPELVDTLKTRDLRIWSAGCSTGEEPYTLAMLTDEVLGANAASWDRKILATDISERVLSHAITGIYDAGSVEKVPATWKSKYFTRINEESWQIKESLRKEVIFRTFNLMQEVLPFKKKFHVIFCRNVMIYFDAETKRKLVDRYYDATEVGGYLYVGQSESVDRATSRYKYVMPAVYRKV